MMRRMARMASSTKPPTEAPAMMPMLDFFWGGERVGVLVLLLGGAVTLARV